MNKPVLTFFVAALAAAVPARAKLTVHEWGTFTVLQAPDGTTLQWYLAERDIAPLPPFVGHAMRGFQIAGKTGTAQRLVNGRVQRSQPYAVRMETPVLYFYPDGAMDVKVAVDFPQGEITEFFPRALTTATGASWQGSLLPATPESLKTVPDASGPLGRHYAAARAVPEAWLFRNSAPAAPVMPSFAVSGDSLLPPPAQPKVETPLGTDHFIFYRGAGNTVPMSISAATKDDRTFTFTNFKPETVPVLFLLRVADGRAVWTRADNLLWQGKKSATQVSLPETSEPLADSTSRLKSEMLAALETEGLTKTEAAAMVATWDNLWFEEPGTRVLALLPQKWVDAALPLQITPQPDSLDRVFVARLELISLDQQNALAGLLDRNPDDPAAAREQLRKLALGRFAPGAVDHVAALKSEELHARYTRLSQPEPAKGVASSLKSSIPKENLEAMREGMRKVVNSTAAQAP
ncbi:MAG TPA: hypothetical protein VHM91_04135 [Verrucomicrobiales bacterium]|nr:hypothetical protein [Verrucomicrobiales bacterium]